MFVKGGAQFGGGKKVHSAKPSSAPGGTKASASAKTTSGAAKRPVAAAAVKESSNQENAAPNSNRPSSDVSKEMAALKAANEESARSFAELRSEMEGLEKERDFYFEKLRDIEIMLQELEDKGEGTELSANIFKILYATADGFEPANSVAKGAAAGGKAGASAGAGIDAGAPNTLDVEPDVTVTAPAFEGESY